MFVKEDATLVEVNPLVKDGDDNVVALDGKVSLDENAAFRHPEHAALEDNAAENPLEVRAKEKGLNYVKLGSQVGIIGNGVGLVMSTLDVVAYAGEANGGVTPANLIARIARGYYEGWHPLAQKSSHWSVQNVGAALRSNYPAARVAAAG